MEPTLPKPIRRKRVQAGAEDLEKEIAALAELDLTSLRRKWADLFGFSPSPRLGGTFIVKAIAYRI